MSKWRVLKSECQNCGKKLIGFEFDGNVHWHHADGNLYRHWIVPMETHVEVLAEGDDNEG